MKVGLQTISWSTQCVSPHEMLHEIKLAGYEGIELAQIRDDFPNSTKFFSALEKEDLELVGVAGGALSDKLDMVASFAGSSKQAFLPYVYTDDWGDDFHTQYSSLIDKEYGFNEPITIAVHPHMFKPIQTENEAIEIINRFDYTKLLIDTAHLSIAGGDILSIIDSNFDKIVAVHLKDWSPEFGRTLPYYSRGFVELGEGRIPIAEIVKKLINMNYTGWIIVEQDYSSEPRESAERSRKYLKRLGI